jgi:hypothetical protein
LSKKLKYLITGHPRCGSGFASSLFSKLGVSCSHEQNPINKDALSSWAFLIQHEDNDGIYPRYGINGSNWRDKYSFTHKITHLRNPFDAIPSIIDENNYDWSFKIRYTPLGEWAIEANRWDGVDPIPPDEEPVYNAD